LYTNLPPGQYEFSVTATNADGTWTAPASVAFSVQPMFYQRPWFAAACVLFVAIGVATAWRLHVRRVRHEFALLVAERARVGREIHDSLLQGLFGLALRCDGLAASFGRVDDALRLQFLQMRKELQEYIADARGSIRDLRSPRLDAADLPTALRHAADRATTGTHVQCDLRIGGTPRRCSKEVDQQVLRIAQEAIANAIRHSDATRVTLELAYGASSLTLRVTDDGRGFEPAAAEGASGHYGLALMRERVQSVGGTLTITAAIAEGATVEAVVPA
jgi:signal transduction histidine kinase